MYLKLCKLDQTFRTTLGGGGGVWVWSGSEVSRPGVT
jgi:hypothetical protein